MPEETKNPENDAATDEPEKTDSGSEPENTPDSIRQAIEKARLQERRKFQSRLDAAEQKARAAEAELELLKSKVSALESGNASTENQSPETTSDPGIRSEIEQLRNMLQETAESYKSEIQSLRGQLERERRIREVTEKGEEFIPEMVTSDDPVKAEEQLAISKAVYRRITEPLLSEIRSLKDRIKELESSHNSDSTPPSSDDPPTPSPTSPTDSPSDVSLNPENIREQLRGITDRSEFEKRKREILSRFKSAAQRNPLT